ncbi:hypothetical protein M427DRAFT_67271 [Gonapodya prolifera JEL478]|uniref:BZIP domain-containing protein n=1 Tax=Gonapodya prolifera (strain JEL478) TaxID=1344416 RepID=A0A139AQW3_GONPJ|nr:hypothetical protein M427DRAFT_67271 [Gonapodya prolifera JEL478]|eukprot:KXS19112.1 hypothetical protein M427DRAFT_67271 [Gonapodya prolifera JEL478]
METMTAVAQAHSSTSASPLPSLSSLLDFGTKTGSSRPRTAPIESSFSLEGELNPFDVSFSVEFAPVDLSGAEGDDYDWSTWEEPHTMTNGTRPNSIRYWSPNPERSPIHDLVAADSEDEDHSMQGSHGAQQGVESPFHDVGKLPGKTIYGNDQHEQKSPNTSLSELPHAMIPKDGFTRSGRDASPKIEKSSPRSSGFPAPPLAAFEDGDWEKILANPDYAKSEPPGAVQFSALGQLVPDVTLPVPSPRKRKHQSASGSLSGSRSARVLSSTASDTSDYASLVPPPGIFSDEESSVHSEVPPLSAKRTEVMVTEDAPPQKGGAKTGSGRGRRPTNRGARSGLSADEQKRRARELNRLAASKCRQKRKERMNAMQDNYETLVQLNESLDLEVADLEMEVKLLKTLIKSTKCKAHD